MLGIAALIEFIKVLLQNLYSGCGHSAIFYKIANKVCR
jgi:hypothetical protein